MIWLVPVLIAAAIAITVYLINKRKLKEIAREKAKQEMSFRIKSTYKSGNYHTVKIGLLDSNGRETKELKITGDEIESDFRIGERIYI